MWETAYDDLESAESRKFGRSFTDSLVTLIKENVEHHEDINAKLVKIS